MPLLPPSAWSRSRKISQSSRAFPGGRTARFNRCKRPSPLIIEPRFSAKPDAGRRTVAYSLAAFDKMSIVTSAEQLRDLARKPKFFIGHPAGRDNRDVCAAELSELKRRVRDRALPIARHQFFSIGNLRLEDAVLGFEIFKVEPAVITHPAG